MTSFSDALPPRCCISPGESADEDDAISFSFPADGAGWEQVGGDSVDNADSGGSTKPSSSGDNGGDTTASSLELRTLIAESNIVGVAFSRTKRSMLATVHARDGGGGGCGGSNRATCVSEEKEKRKGETEGNRDRAMRWGQRLEGCSIVCVWNAEAVHVRLII